MGIGLCVFIVRLIITGYTSIMCDFEESRHVWRQELAVIGIGIGIVGICHNILPLLAFNERWRDAYKGVRDLNEFKIDFERYL